MPGKPPKRARRDPETRSRADRLQVWRGVLLVAVGAGGLAGLGVAWSAREGDTLTTGLFTGALLGLFALAAVAATRVRHTLSETK